MPETKDPRKLDLPSPEEMQHMSLDELQGFVEVLSEIYDEAKEEEKEVGEWKKEVRDALFQILTFFPSEKTTLSDGYTVQTVRTYRKLWTYPEEIAQMRRDLEGEEAHARASGRATKEEVLHAAYPAFIPPPKQRMT